MRMSSNNSVGDDRSTRGNCRISIFDDHNYNNEFPALCNRNGSTEFLSDQVYFDDKLKPRSNKQCRKQKKQQNKMKYYRFIRYDEFYGINYDTMCYTCKKCGSHDINHRFYDEFLNKYLCNPVHHIFIDTTSYPSHIDGPFYEQIMSNEHEIVFGGSFVRRTVGKEHNYGKNKWPNNSGILNDDSDVHTMFVEMKKKYVRNTYDGGKVSNREVCAILDGDPDNKSVASKIYHMRTSVPDGREEMERKKFISSKSQLDKRWQHTSKRNNDYGIYDNYDEYDDYCDDDEEQVQLLSFRHFCERFPSAFHRDDIEKALEYEENIGNYYNVDTDDIYEYRNLNNCNHQAVTEKSVENTEEYREFVRAYDDLDDRSCNSNQYVYNPDDYDPDEFDPFGFAKAMHMQYLQRKQRV